MTAAMTKKGDARFVKTMVPGFTGIYPPGIREDVRPCHSLNRDSGGQRAITRQGIKKRTTNTK